MSLVVGCGAVVTEAPSATSDAGEEARIERPEPETGATEPSEGGTATCNRTADRLTISITGAATATCAPLGPGPEPGPTVLRGQIVNAAASSFTLDMCSPAADCVPTIATIAVNAPGLDLGSLKARSYVEVTYRGQNFFGCHASIVVKSIASWDGAKNPVDVGERIYLAGGDGDDPKLPFAVTRVPTGCFTRSSSCGGGVAPDWYSYRFVDTTVPMGATATFSANGQTFRARNLRAFYEGDCDAYWDFAFFATSL